LLELDDAVQRICDGFERKGFEIAFPRHRKYLLKTLNMLPRPLYFALMRSAGMRKPKKAWSAFELRKRRQRALARRAVLDDRFRIILAQPHARLLQLRGGGRPGLVDDLGVEPRK